MLLQFDVIPLDQNKSVVSLNVRGSQFRRCLLASWFLLNIKTMIKAGTLCICYVYLALFPMGEFMLNFNGSHLYFLLILLAWCEMLIALIPDQMVIAETTNLHFTLSK